MFTDLPNLICKACATVNTNIFLFGLIVNSVFEFVISIGLQLADEIQGFSVAEEK